MPNENKKMYLPSKSTGTIPKVKQRNNNNTSSTDRRSNLVSNNLGNVGNEHESPECNRQHYRNHSRNLPFFPIMDGTHQETNGIRQNGSCNGTATTPTDSHPTSRRNSSGLSKCENVAKYPDKKQIESKLSQIQEYLQVATSMRANMKKTDEQMQGVAIQSQSADGNSNEDDATMDEEQLNAIITDLVDSEDKLKTILNDIERSQQFSDNGSDHVDPELVRQNKNELEHKVDAATRDLQMLKEQGNLLLHLQLNAENQLREARLAQAKLAKATPPTPRNIETEWFMDSDTVSDTGASTRNNIDFRELEDRIKTFNIDDNGKIPVEHFQNQIDHMQGHIQQMRDGNDNRTQLIQILDARDAQLQAQHTTLQGKLHELHTKKQQVDQLVDQLQHMNDESEDDEMGCQVKKIVNMKEQLAKLKDMLNLVQNTENSLDGQEHNGMNFNEDMEENVNILIAKTDNLMMQQNRVPHVVNVAVSSNERHVKEKQVNKKSMNANETERIKIQAELRAKRKELEDLMCKHKAANSNINHDVSGHSLFENTPNAWFPMDSNIFNTRVQRQSSESDDCPEDDPNEYSAMNSSSELNTTAVQSMPALNYPTTNYIRKRSHETSQGPRVEMPHDSFMTLSSSRSPPARSVRSTTPAFPPRENATGRNQLHKQLELIKSVCDSMLDSGGNDETAEQQTVPMRVRNNLTPSPIYSEPRQYTPRPGASTTNVHNGNALNVVSFPEGANHMNVPTPPTANDSAAYNTWLTTNALQTQTFILNTLNQCCQMLWHQQKELSTLRHTVNVMQDRCPSVYHEDNTPMCMQSNPCLYQSNPNNMPLHHSNTNYLANNFRPPPPPQPQPKMNHPNTSGSMPNLNGHCTHSPAPSTTNMEHACCNNSMPNNNAVHQHTNIIGEHQLNTNHVMHHNQTMPSPIWNGQALNNQVAPGNRANNYWDNFRSYSRQNLLSTKSNDGPQNLQRPSSNSILSKSNSHNESIAATATATSAGNTPTRRSKICHRHSAIATSSPERREACQAANTKTPNQDGAYSLPAFSVEALSSGDETVSRTTNRNEWTSESGATSPKSKLFEELRENVYKEVASLISANEGRPHFLIQLFRDLQLISSDPLRRKTLQSIQSVITASLANSTGGALRQQISGDNDTVITEESSGADYELLTMHQHDASATASEGNISDLTDNGSKDVLLTSIIWPILNHNIGEDITEQDNQEQFHEALSNYLNIRNEEDAFMDIVEQRPKLQLNNPMYEFPYVDEDEMPRLLNEMQNDDLAEADQSRVVDEDEEGAVGGLLNIQVPLEDEVPILEIEVTTDESEQGLDQVPTRLSNPPSIGCSPKSQ